MRTRLPEPQVWGGWGPTPNSFSDLAYKCYIPRTRWCAAESRPPTRTTNSTHNADQHATSVGIRAGPPVAVVRVHTLHAAAPLVARKGGTWGHVSSPVSTAYPIVIRLHAPPSDENRPKTLSRARHASPSASTVGAPPSASTAGAAPRVLLRHWLTACHCQRPSLRFAAAVRLHPYMHESQSTPTKHPRPQPHALAYGMVPRSRPRSSKLVGGQQGKHHGGAGRRPKERPN